MSNNKLRFCIITIITIVYTSSLAKSEEAYSPPKMFDEFHIQIYSPVVKSVSKPTLDPVFKPKHKPYYKIPVIKKISTSKNIGVSQVIQKALPINTPSVEAQSLVPFSKKNNGDNGNEQTIETTIAFLPSSVDLTKTQKSKFKHIIRTYFIERNAKEIIIRVFATPTDTNEQNSAKRKALARGLNVRDWLINLKVKPEQITLKAIGASNDAKIPDRADIKILF